MNAAKIIPLLATFYSVKSFGHIILKNITPYKTRNHFPDLNAKACEFPKYVMKRAGIFYYVRRIPADLKKHYSVKRLCFSLRTVPRGASGFGRFGNVIRQRDDHTGRQDHQNPYPLGE